MTFPRMWRGLTVLAPGLLVSTFLAATAKGGTIGPDTFGYTATNSTPFSFSDISGTGTKVLGDNDDDVVNASIGFNFSFYGSSYNNISISSNGLITFGGSNSDFAPVNLDTTSPATDIPSVAVWWDDWSTLKAPLPLSDAVYYATAGSPGSREFIVQWNDTFACCPRGTSPVTFEAIFFEGSNNILFQYQTTISGVTDGDVGDANDHGGSGTVGIRDTGGQANGRVLQWEFAQPVLTDDEAILFTTNSIPEPSASSLMVLGIMLLLAIRKAR